MSINIEIKSTIPDCEELRERLVCLGIKEEYTMYQRDIFYRFPFGRLKLRNIDEKQYELIIYFRRNSLNPKPSKYHRIKTSNPNMMNKVLTHMFGVRGVVEKERLLFLQNNIRFHIDRVKNLGNYFEIEYAISDLKRETVAREKVKALLNMLEISSSQLISDSYIDLLSRETNTFAR